MNYKKFAFILGIALIFAGIMGLLGFGSWSIKIPEGAVEIDQYSYVEELPDGNFRLTVHSKPLRQFWLFDIMDIESDSRRYTVNNSYPENSGEGSIYAVNKIDSTGNVIRNGYCEFNLRTLPISDITYATFHFRAATVYSETVFLDVYRCNNIDHASINWYNQPARAQNPIETFLVPPETHPDGTWQSYQLDVSDIVRGEFAQDKIVTFGFFSQEYGFAYIARHNIDPFPILTLDFTPSQTSPPSGGGNSSSDSSSNTDSDSSTNGNSNYMDFPPPEPEEEFNNWALLSIIAGAFLTIYGKRGG